MKKNDGPKILHKKPIGYFALVLIFLPFFVNNASARHAETRAGWAANGIASSLHNLATSGPVLANPSNAGVTGNANSGKGTSEMCVYCHTPHFAERGSGPLWNRRMSPDSGPLDAYGTTIAKNEDGNANMFSTIGCLSCHDGVTSFDSLINQPGKGVGNPDVDITVDNKKWRYRMEPSNGFTPAFGKDHFGAGECSVCHSPMDPAPERADDPSNYLYFNADIRRLIIGQQTAPGTAANKTNLTDDHPIGVLYRGNGDTGASASLRARTVMISSLNMDIETENGAPMPALVPGNLWAVKGFISDTASIQDLLRSGTGQGSGNYVQCTSCHDPHFKNQTNPESWFYGLIRNYGVLSADQPDFYLDPSVQSNHQAFEVNGLFLRRVGGNSDSGLCRTCHDKG